MTALRSRLRRVERVIGSPPSRVDRSDEIPAVLAPFVAEMQAAGGDGLANADLAERFYVAWAQLEGRDVSGWLPLPLVEHPAEPGSADRHVPEEEEDPTVNLEWMGIGRPSREFLDELLYSKRP